MVGCNNLYPVIEVEEPMSSRTTLMSMEAIDPGFSDVAKPGPEVTPSSPEVMPFVPIFSLIIYHYFCKKKILFEPICLFHIRRIEEGRILSFYCENYRRFV